MSLVNASGGRAGQGPAAEKVATATKQHVRDEGNAVRAVAEGVFYPPAGRRHQGVVVVRSCPACGQLHLHRAEASGDVDGTDRRGSCGAAYVVQLLPADAVGGVA